MKRGILLPAVVAMAAVKASALGIADLPSFVRWYGQDSLRIQLGNRLIWIDPVGVPLTEAADLILITHDHQDHYNLGDIKKLTGPNTKILAGFDGSPFERIRPGDSTKLGDIRIDAVPAYNIKKSGHPKSKAYCGFIITAMGLKLYIAGDTERIPEMKSITCDVAFLPLGQTYTMGSVAEAAAAAIDVGAKLAVPVHFGMYEGSEADAKEFAKLLAGKVQVLELPRLR